MCWLDHFHLRPAPNDDKDLPTPQNIGNLTLLVSKESPRSSTERPRLQEFAPLIEPVDTEALENQSSLPQKPSPPIPPREIVILHATVQSDPSDEASGSEKSDAKNNSSENSPRRPKPATQNINSNESTAEPVLRLYQHPSIVDRCRGIFSSDFW